jgi:transcriptional regulator with XRE-family HTH domain
MATARVAERTAQAVSQAIITAGETPTSLSGKTLIAKTTLRRKLRGISEFTPTELYLIAGALGTSIEAIMPADIYAEPAVL